MNSPLLPTPTARGLYRRKRREELQQKAAKEAKVYAIIAKKIDQEISRFRTASPRKNLPLVLASNLQFVM